MRENLMNYEGLKAWLKENKQFLISRNMSNDYGTRLYMIRREYQLVRISYYNNLDKIITLLPSVLICNT
jgi:hypothetical protein